MLTEQEIDALFNAPDLMINDWSDTCRSIDDPAHSGPSRSCGKHCLGFIVSRSCGTDFMEALDRVSGALGYARFNEFTVACRERPVEVLDRIYSLKE